MYAGIAGICLQRIVLKRLDTLMNYYAFLQVF